MFIRLLLGYFLPHSMMVIHVVAHPLLCKPACVTTTTLSILTL